MRHKFNFKETNILQKLQISMGGSSFHYGFEYLGVSEKLV